MLLNKLELVNFRQFKGSQSVVFSEDKQKNVTIIIGKTGTGKTTFAQAFIWCLYGKTTFSDQILLCKATALEMNSGDERTVSVVLKFVHGNIDYKCSRRQLYVKDSNGTVKAKGETSFSIEYKNKKTDGQWETVKATQREGEINKILPVELSGYFFFDGERIGTMSRDIVKGKSKEFSEAVRRLLGLSALETSLKHLNESQTSVVKLYNKSFDSTGNEEFGKLITEITSLENEIAEKKNRISEIEHELDTVHKQQNWIISEQEKISSMKIILEERKLHEANLVRAENARQMDIKDEFKLFSDGCYNFFIKKAINDAVELLSKADISDSGIPDIHKRTIDFLINRGTCICGTKIEKDSDIYYHLKELLKLIPPQSLGTSIRQFISVANEKAKVSDFYERFETIYASIRRNEEEIADENDAIASINNKLAGSNENDIANLQDNLIRWKNKEGNLNIEMGECTQKLSELTEKINGKEQAKSKFANIGENNKKISLYIAYAKYVYDELKKQYLDEETKIREEFEQAVNKKFRNIYNGGFSLSVDEKYNIKVIEMNTNETVDLSTAQSLSVILAFISAVIEIAKKSENGENKLRTTESYPLVMDAPLSAFDKERIQMICDVLPKTAEQVIVFINDKDGEIYTKPQK